MKQRKITSQKYNQGQGNQNLGMKMCQLADGRVVAYADYIKEMQRQK